MAAFTILWRRLDVPGHDACRLEAADSGRTLDGTAVFREHGTVSRLAYRVTCDESWRTREGRVRGWVDGRAVDFDVRRTAAGAWTVNGAPVPGLEHCTDLDLGFTPATNLFQLRRIGLAPGEAADVPVAWLDVEAGSLELLAQRYERRSDLAYWYEAPKFEYAALLEVDRTGFVRRYPGLWEAELDATGG
jgi:uncharacterized protein